MAFAKEMIVVKQELEKLGHMVFIPEGADEYASGKLDKEKMGGSEGVKRNIAKDLIRQHHNLISGSDAILVLNYERKGVPGYVGGSAFLEIGYAYILNKKIFLVDVIPDVALIRQEIEAMQPRIINGDLNLIS